MKSSTSELGLTGPKFPLCYTQDTTRRLVRYCRKVSTSYLKITDRLTPNYIVFENEINHLKRSQLALRIFNHHLCNYAKSYYSGLKGPNSSENLH